MDYGLFFTADVAPPEEALYTVAIGEDGQPAPAVLISAPDERVFGGSNNGSGR